MLEVPPDYPRCLLKDLPLDQEEQPWPILQTGEAFFWGLSATGTKQDTGLCPGVRVGAAEGEGGDLSLIWEESQIGEGQGHLGRATHRETWAWRCEGEVIGRRCTRRHCPLLAVRERPLEKPALSQRGKERRCCFLSVSPGLGSAV